MNSKHVLIYGCDFCRKRSRNRKAIQTHEKGCVMNPERECGFCKNHGITQTPLANLLAALEGSGDPDDNVLEAAHGCPMCTLAAVMQSNDAEGLRANDDEAFYFEYHAALEKFDKEHDQCKF